MPVDRSHIRVKAFAVIVDEHADRHVVARMRTSEHPVFHRSLGGSIELGELAVDAVVREIREELDATLVDPQLLGVLESVFTIDGQQGHEVVFVFVGTLAEPSVVPDEGRPFMDVDVPSSAEWRPIAGVRDVPLLPIGLQGLIDDWRSRRARAPRDP